MRPLPFSVSIAPARVATPLLLLSLLSALTACGEHTEPPRAAVPTVTAGTPLTLRDTTIARTFDANGVAAPLQQATVSTKLMGTVTAVRVQEGDLVNAGQVLVEIDARDLTAKAAQVAASIANAEAMQQEAATHAARFRALYADSAATKAQFDAAETGLARAEAGVRAAKAGAAELDAMRSYATVRAPFTGQVTTRLADIGAFAAPGAPLITIQDDSRLRLRVAVPADVATGVRRGATLAATVDGAEVMATVEGVVPSGAGNLYTINALVVNPSHRYRAGSAAVLHVPLGTRSGVLVPTAAVVRDGDLTGVIVRQNGTDARRWVRLGETMGTHTEILGGLRAGEVIVVPASSPASATPRPGA